MRRRRWIWVAPLRHFPPSGWFAMAKPGFTLRFSPFIDFSGMGALCFSSRCEESYSEEGLMDWVRIIAMYDSDVCLGVTQSGNNALVFSACLALRPYRNLLGRRSFFATSRNASLGVVFSCAHIYWLIHASLYLGCQPERVLLSRSNNRRITRTSLHPEFICYWEIRYLLLNGCLRPPLCPFQARLCPTSTLRRLQPS